MTPLKFLSLAIILLIPCHASPDVAESTENHIHSDPRTRSLQLSCTSDDDCGMEEYCNKGLCRPGGYCDTTLDCKNPSNLYSMIECVGFLYCTDQNECAVECAGSHCPNYDEVDCKENPPCESTECSEDYVSCVNDDCGGCNAIFFTASGEQACTFTRNSMEECINDADCGDSMFCLNGLCAEFGTCGETADCLNPSNAYTENNTDCEGYTTCVSSTCVTSCSDDECPSGNKVQCYSPPCAVTTCTEEAVSCVDNTCGDCTAIFFNASGARVCEDAMPDADCGQVDQCEQTDTWERSLCRAKVFIRRTMCPLLRN